MPGDQRGPETHLPWFVSLCECEAMYAVMCLLVLTCDCMHTLKLDVLYANC